MATSKFGKISLETILKIDNNSFRKHFTKTTYKEMG